MNLVSLVEDQCLDSMVKYIHERYDIAVSTQQASEVLCDLAVHYHPSLGGEGHLQVRLKESLRRLGCLQPLFVGSKEDDPKVVWNELHLFTDEPPENYGLPELDESEYPCPKPPQYAPPPDPEPNYARSKITEYALTHRPRAINKTANNVARIPEKDNP